MREDQEEEWWGSVMAWGLDDARARRVRRTLRGPHSGGASRLGWASGPMVDGLDDRPSAARIYDWLLGGWHNLGVDREAGTALLGAFPQACQTAMDNRDFLRRVVLFMISRGIRQFLDLGSGLPTAGNVHQVAQSVALGSRVVYVDSDPMVAEMWWRALAGNTDTAVVYADLRAPETVLGSPEVAELIDFSQPVGLLAVSALHFLSDADNPAGVLAAYRSVLAPGSLVGLSHMTADHATGEKMQAVTELYARTSTPLTARSREEIEGLFTGLESVAPGVVPVEAWRPVSGGTELRSLDIYGGVGMVRARR